MEENIQIDKYILGLQEFDGFCTLFYRMCGEYSTQEKAYDAAERLYSGHFGKTRFASWESFKNYKNQKLRDRIKKTNLSTQVK